MQSCMACFISMFNTILHYYSAKEKYSFLYFRAFLRLVTTVSYITTAVPEQVTMSIEPPCPTVS